MNEKGYEKIRIGGIQKLTLLDYPNQVACTVFLGGCNMRCPFCHNRDLVFVPSDLEWIDPEELLSFLKKRKGILDAVCITGGEPLTQPGLEAFVAAIKNMGYLVKLDTNGLFPDRLEQIVETGMIDYVAMDVKNTMDKYAMTAGIPEAVFRKDLIKKSIAFLFKEKVDYEFRTTVVKELHTEEDIVSIAKMIKGAKRYYLQQFVDSGRCIKQGLSAYTKEEMEEICKRAKAILPGTELRGVK